MSDKNEKVNDSALYTVIPNGWSGVSQFQLFLSLEQAMQAAKAGDRVMRIPVSRAGEDAR